MRKMRAALQEIRWTGIGNLEQEKGVILYSGKDDGNHVEGAGFHLSKKAYGALMEFTPISSRIAKIRLNAKWFNITILCLHAQPEITDDEEKNEWYDLAQSEIDQIPRHDVLFILGDINAKIGKEVNAFQGSIRLHSLHQESNDNGIRLATFALQNSMVIGGTIFPHKDSHKGTWISPDGNTINQIDHIMIKKKFRSALFDTRAFRGADCDSDHMLVVRKLRIKLKSKILATMKTIKPNIEKLEETDVKNAYAINEKKNRFGLLEEEEVTSDLETIKSVVTEAAMESLGPCINAHRSNNWFDEECRSAAERRKRCRMKWIEDSANVDMSEDLRVSRNLATSTKRRKKREKPGFRTNRATADQIFTIRQALEKYWEFNENSYHLFIDFKQAYDSVHRLSLWNMLKFFHIPEKLINLLQIYYLNMTCRIKVGGILTEPFNIHGGLKQGCALSTLLFNLVLEWIMGNTPPTRLPTPLDNTIIDRLGYADVVDLCGEHLPSIEET
ncbi:uncharacterized protein [Palaemon carinicauda]|uniref:uncharacterized protein n=1 Tax=Palaemon carinicauda TaxID=392227 RepID=UPI0035B63ADA